jgi:hypothetical protein
LREVTKCRTKICVEEKKYVGILKESFRGIENIDKK